MSTQIYVKNSKTKSDETLKNEIGYKKANNYYLPSIIHIMLKYYSTSDGKNKVATSTASEIYYRILKIDYEMHCVSLKRMLLEHIELLEGATKNGRLTIKLLMKRMKEKKTELLWSPTCYLSKYKKLEILDHV